MKTKSRGGLWVVAVLAMVMMASCAKPPAAEKNAAQGAMDKAVAAQAELYAVKTLNEAKQLWDNAEAKMQQKAYQEAKAGYVAAQAGFEKAASEVEAGKKALADENAAVLTAMEQSWKSLSAQAAKKAKKLQADAKVSWKTDSESVAGAIKAAKENVLNPAEIKSKLEEAKAMIEKWVESFKK